ncbi:MAG: (2Fe-2S)-binding protein, partial [Gammaproteobacteria bacterium]|nr:(2Fe-2S)-binding protein [Gammaproteobacteria bacterium]
MSARRATGGRVERARPLGFRLEGRTLGGFAGDTLASALLANGVQLLGRSFKYHRPRGLLSAGAEEPNGLLTIGEGARRTPNLPATMIELHEGLVCERQNGWPSVEYDAKALLGALAPLLGAGFYYKTFMGPRRGSWMFYEPFIRRAAGLGRATHAPDPDRYETRDAHVDVLVIGSGPAGLAAARAAGRAGARVLLVEQDFLLGGSLLRAPVDSPEEMLRGQLVADLADLHNVEIQTRTTAFGVYDGATVALIERHEQARPDPDRGEARETLITVRARCIVHATGAIERPLVFGDNDRPGVLLADALRSYLNRHAIDFGAPALIATNNDSAWRAAVDLAAAGTSVVLADERAVVAEPLLAAARAQRIEVRLATRLVRALGGRSLRGAELRREGARNDERIPCRVIGMSGGWAPTVHLTAHTGVRPRYDAAAGAHLPGSLPDGVWAAGACAGQGGRSLADGHA